MKITPTRAIAWMWLLCSLWLPGIWWLQTLLPAHAGAHLPTALPVLGGGVLLLLLAALFLSLSLRIEQTRLRIAVRAALRGEAGAGAAPEWRALLDDVRLSIRRLGLERERLALRAQRAEEALREQGERSSQAARSAEDSLQQVEQQWLRLLPALPSADEGQARLRALQGSTQAMDGAQEYAHGLREGLAGAQAALQALRQAVQEQGGEAEREFLQRATRLAESLQLLSLNFRLALERLELIPGVRGESLDTVVQDVEPLCLQATNLLDSLPQATSRPRIGVEALQPLEQALQPLPERAASLLAALQQANDELRQVLPEAQAAAARDWRAVLEKVLQDDAPAPADSLAGA